MKKIFTSIFLLTLQLSITAQPDNITSYKKTIAMIPMRDGIKLYTVIFSPVNASKPVPVLILQLNKTVSILFINTLTVFYFNMVSLRVSVNPAKAAFVNTNALCAILS